MNTRIDFSQNSVNSADSRAAVMVGLNLSSVFANLPESSLTQLAAKTYQRNVKDGEVLCHQADIAHTVWLVLEGWVKLTRETLNGSEAVWDILGQSQIVGLETLLPPYQYTVRAVTVGGGSLLAMPHSILRNMLETTPAFALQLLKQTNNRQQEEMLEIEHRAQQTAPQRIGCFLLKLAGTPQFGSVTLQLPFDKGLLAARLGMQPETFSRALAKLKQETGIVIEGAKLTFDATKLESYTCSACSGSYPCC